jgi:hypothetical protein
MARRIIRGITKLSEDEKRRQAFSKKQESDAQHMAALMKVIQDTPYSREVYHGHLRDCLSVLYPKAWDTVFKATGDRHLDLIKAAHRYFFGQPLDTIAFASRPSEIYWSLFSTIENQVKQGNHLKDSDFTEKQGFLREAQQVTPEAMGYTAPATETAMQDRFAAIHETNRRRRLNPAVAPTLWQNFLDDVRMRIRRTHPDYSLNPDMQRLRTLFDEGRTEAEGEEYVRQRLWVEGNRDAARERNNPDTLARRLLQPAPAANVRSVGTPAQFSDFQEDVVRRMRLNSSTWMPTTDERTFISASFNNGRSAHQVAARLYEMMRERTPQPARPPRRRRQETTARQENPWLASVLRQLGNSRLTGTAKERMDYMKRLFRQGYSVEDGAIAVLARFSVE